MSSHNTRSQAKETSVEVALTARRFILNIFVIQTKFICIVDSISMRDMVPTLSIKFTTVNIVRLFTRTLACAYSIINKIRHLITRFCLLEDMHGVLHCRAVYLFAFIYTLFLEGNTYSYTSHSTKWPSELT